MQTNETAHDDGGGSSRAAAVGGWGLTGADGVALPLTSVAVRGELVAMAARLSICNTYTNTTGAPVDATFRAYLADLGAVCGVLVHVDGQAPIDALLTRRLRRRVVADYDDDQQDDDDDDDDDNFNDDDSEFGSRSPDDAFADDAVLRALNPDGDHDLLACSVGVLPPGQSVRFEVTYIAELYTRGDLLRCVVPTTFAERVVVPHSLRSSLDAPQPSRRALVALELDLALAMPQPIVSVASASHSDQLQVLLNGSRARVTLRATCSESLDVVLAISLLKPQRSCLVAELVTRELLASSGATTTTTTATARTTMMASANDLDVSSLVNIDIVKNSVALMMIHYPQVCFVDFELSNESVLVVNVYLKF